MSAWDNPAEMLTRADTARALGDTALAYQMYARASEINPQDAAAWRGRAETCANPDEALVSYAYANALAPQDQTLKQTLDASVAQRLTTQNSNDAPLLVAMGQELAEVGLTTEAHAFFQRATNLDETSTDAWVWLAGLEPDKDKQTEYLNQALALNPRDSRARAGLLALKPPAPPSPTVTEARAQELAAASQAQAESSMERLRKLREASASTPPPAQPAPAAAPTFTPTSTPAPAPVAPQPAANNTMRYVLLGLLALVVLLLFAGIFLLLTQ
ncbi:MAG: hypothetical protein HDKAJFGB_00930 [Anaerolineae bacterium]|nr:hypothetical protein [Anaerolineae bacterium]RIK33834.1 MAG: hypothetical protein DCC52_02265 [Chloroflexota bacterium]